MSKMVVKFKVKRLMFASLMAQLFYIPFAILILLFRHWSIEKAYGKFIEKCLGVELCQ
jgi:hypothetical protein